ncbi:RNA-binding protein 34 [Bufo gargarizans]|uniref:RNA-binding protein 34 n=1 Tax=Bufo gargarizans TaxID=30331 RepID=UPI001CF4A536|nr:RNA-binding protein 34 [Bufo gargarizans]
MPKEELKKKPKKVKKNKKVAEATCESKVAEAAAESYVAGEVSGSLFPKKSELSSTSLSSLFDIKAPSTQPLYVPVVITKAKRKLPESDGAKQSKQSPDVLRAAEAKRKVAKKELPLSEKRVEDREQALTNADEDESVKAAKLKSLKTKKNPDDEELMQHDKKRLIKAEERVKNKRTIFVGNLPTACTKQMLRTCFKDFGLIESMRFRSVARADPSMSRKVATIQRTVHSKRKSMNAYVVFKEQDSAAKALVRNGVEISSGFHIRVDLASKSSSHNNKKTVFVGNLPYDIEDEVLREHFSQCGGIEGVRIIRDAKTGIGKGFGYVLFQGADSVQLALKLGNSELMGRKLRIKRCLSNPAKGAQKNGGFKQKLEPLKKGQAHKSNTFVGETADGAKVKHKKPKNKIKKTATKPNKKPKQKPSKQQVKKK